MKHINKNEKSSKIENVNKMEEKLIKGKNTKLEECIAEELVEWQCIKKWERYYER